MTSCNVTLYLNCYFSMSELVGGVSGRVLVIIGKHFCELMKCEAKYTGSALATYNICDNTFTLLLLVLSNIIAH